VVIQSADDVVQALSNAGRGRLEQFKGARHDRSGAGCGTRDRDIVK
jgi:hypothetical protein